MAGSSAHAEVSILLEERIASNGLASARNQTEPVKGPPASQQDCFFAQLLQPRLHPKLPPNGQKADSNGFKTPLPRPGMSLPFAGEVWVAPGNPELTIQGPAVNGINTGIPGHGIVQSLPLEQMPHNTAWICPDSPAQFPSPMAPCPQGNIPVGSQAAGTSSDWIELSSPEFSQGYGPVPSPSMNQRQPLQSKGMSGPALPGSPQISPGTFRSQFAGWRASNRGLSGQAVGESAGGGLRGESVCCHATAAGYSNIAGVHRLHRGEGVQLNSLDTGHRVSQAR